MTFLMQVMSLQISYRESGIKYITAWEIEQLLDLIDDMKDLYGISPRKSDEPDMHGDYLSLALGRSCMV